MKNTVIKTIMRILIIFAMCAPFSISADIISDMKNEKLPIDVRSGSFEINIQESTITFYEDIEAVRGKITFNCRKLIVFLNKDYDPDDSNSIDMKTQVEKIEAIQDVKISRTDGSMATAERALYILADQKVYLTGNPVIKWGESYTESSKITLDLDEDRYYAEAEEGERVRAFFVPSEIEKGQ